jgi:hypothetical protein
MTRKTRIVIADYLEPEIQWQLSRKRYNAVFRAALQENTLRALHSYHDRQLLLSIILKTLRTRPGFLVFPYDPILFSSRKQSPKPARITQLVLPFSVRGLGTFGVQAKIAPTGENRFELRVDVEPAV